MRTPSCCGIDRARPFRPALRPLRNMCTVDEVLGDPPLKPPSIGHQLCWTRAETSPVRHADRLTVRTAARRGRGIGQEQTPSVGVLSGAMRQALAFPLCRVGTQEICYACRSSRATTRVAVGVALLLRRPAGMERVADVRRYSSPRQQAMTVLEAVSLTRDGSALGRAADWSISLPDRYPPLPALGRHRPAWIRLPASGWDPAFWR